VVAAMAAATAITSCVSVLSLGEDNYEDIAKDTCAYVSSTCEGVFDQSLIWGSASCVDVMTAATSEQGGVTADEVGACFDFETCVQLLDCLTDYNVFKRETGDTCRASGEPCLEQCYPANCLSPHRCCDSACVDGVCK
jgi:hypothetical protein